MATTKQTSWQLLTKLLKVSKEDQVLKRKVKE
jgi:hypothetical protein